MEPSELKAIIDIVTEIVGRRLGVQIMDRNEIYMRDDANPQDPTDPGPQWSQVSLQLFPSGRFQQHEITAMNYRINSHRIGLPEQSFGKALLNWYKNCKLIGLQRVICNSPNSLRISQQVAQLAINVFGPEEKKLAPEDIKVLESFLDDIEPMTLNKDMHTLLKVRSFLKNANGLTSKDIFEFINQPNN